MDMIYHKIIHKIICFLIIIAINTGCNSRDSETGKTTVRNIGLRITKCYKDEKDRLIVDYEIINQGNCKVKISYNHGTFGIKADNSTTGISVPL
jgi:hypothetical protein